MHRVHEAARLYRDKNAQGGGGGSHRNAGVTPHYKDNECGTPSACTQQLAGYRNLHCSLTHAHSTLRRIRLRGNTIGATSGEGLPVEACSPVSSLSPYAPFCTSPTVNPTHLT